MAAIYKTTFRKNVGLNKWHLGEKSSAVKWTWQVKQASYWKLSSVEHANLGHDMNLGAAVYSTT